MSSIPPGWYADPVQEHHERYWDGTQWSDHTRPIHTRGAVTLRGEEAGPPRPASTPMQAPLDADERRRSVTVGLAVVVLGWLLVALGVVLHDLHWPITTGAFLVIAGAGALLRGLLGRARSSRDVPSAPGRDQTLALRPSQRVYRGLLLVAIPVGVLVVLTSAALASGGEFGPAAGLLALAALFAFLGWYGAWGLGGRNRIVADAWGIRFGSLLGTRAYGWDEVEGFEPVQRGAAIRLAYRLHRKRGGLFPLGYQPEDAQLLNSMLAQHRPRAAASS